MRFFAAFFTALALSLAPYPAAQAQSAKPAHASGVVKSVNVAKGTVSIAHGPVASLNWPPMTMTFVAREKKMLENLQPGTKVEFEFVQEGSRYTITSLKQ
jgi:Cu(I)/Ag(I) efflux system protein CusF